jgi:maltooligosyltrehalose trehalohydrolase
MWLRDYHVDGLRIDAVHAFVDTSAVHILEQLSAEIEQLEASLGRHLVLIAESDLNDPRIIRSREAWGYGMDAQWSDDFHHALHSALTGEQSGYYEDFGRLQHLATAIQQAFVYAGHHSDHRERRHGRPPDNTQGWRFVVAAQNHDQVGNRARGERLSHLVSNGRLKIAAAILLTAPFVPMLFQGEEWAASTPFQYFTAHEDPRLGAAVSEGRRREFSAFGWKPEDVPDPQDVETFRRSKLRWEELSQPPHRDMLSWYRALIALRRRTPELLDGDFERCDVRCDEAAGWLVVDRAPLVIACNLADTRRQIPLGGPASLVLGSDAAVQVDAAACLLPPDSVAILRRT